MGNILDLVNIVNVSVAAQQAGAGQYSSSNIALFTEEPFAASFGTLGYGIYLGPTQVGVDFGTSSKTYAMALAIFSQQPNILAGGGYLVIIPFLPQVDKVAFNAAPTSGSFQFVFNGGSTAYVPYNSTSSNILSYVNAVSGQLNTTLVGNLSSSVVFTYSGNYGAQAQVQVVNSNLSTSTAVTTTISTTSTAETFGSAITRANSLIQFFGALGTDIFSQADQTSAATVVQALQGKMAGFCSRTAADVNPGGLLDLLRSGTFTQSRGTFYGGATDISALTEMAAYWGRGLCVDFTGNNTTITLQLKQLATIQPDPSMTQSLYNLCQTAGADIYGNIRGVSGLLTANANGGFFDEIYNLQSFVGAVQIAYFNVIAQTPTKVPQTDPGMNSFRTGVRAVCDQYVTNAYLAPGTWTSATTFGNQADFLANITQKGYYIYIPPVASQTQTNRQNRIAPLMQIAVKEAGAVHKGNVIIFINP